MRSIYLLLQAQIPRPKSKIETSHQDHDQEHGPNQGTRATLGQVTDGSTMQDWIRRSLTAATNKNDNNRAVNHSVIGRPSFGSVSRSPLTGHYSSVQNFKAPPTSHPSAAAHQKRCHFSQWLQKHQDTIPQARAHVSQNKKQQLFVSTQSPRRGTAAKRAHVRKPAATRQ